jgi:ribokinase
MEEPQSDARFDASLDARFDVVVVGSLNLDLVARTPRIPNPGETVQGTGYAELPGGKGLNQAVAAARVGARVAMVGAVGDDAAGTTLRDVARRDGVDDRWITIVTGVPTGRALIAVDDAAENSIVVVPGANAHVEMTELPPARVVLAQLEIDPAVVVAAFGLARRRGATTVLNPAPAELVPPELLTLADVVVPNQHELEVLGGRAALAAAGVTTLVVTLGADGADLLDGADPSAAPHHVDPFPVDPVDTTGAGDAFCGGLAARLAAGDTLTEALVFASANGALATTRAGAVPSLPTLAETRALIDAR